MFVFTDHKQDPSVEADCLGLGGTDSGLGRVTGICTGSGLAHRS